MPNVIQKEVPLPEEAGEVRNLFCPVCRRETSHQIVEFGFQKPDGAGGIVKNTETVGICLVPEHKGPTNKRFLNLGTRVLR